jgi:ABC-type sugar transport system substrate-binding protein
VATDSTSTQEEQATAAPAEKETASADATEAKALKVGIVVAEYNEWNHLYYAEIEEKCEEFGWTSEIFDAGQDVNQQINLVNSCVAQGFDAITIQPADNAALAPAMKKAAEAGLIVVSHYDMDESLGINDMIYQVLFGQKASGVLEAEEYVKEAGESGKVAIIAGLTGADNAQQRTAGFMEVFDQYPDIEVVQTVYCDWIKIASHGFYESSIDAIKDGKFMFTISYPAGFFARDAMDLIKQVSDGEQVDRIQTLGMLLVTKDNVDSAPHD